MTITFSSREFTTDSADHDIATLLEMPDTGHFELATPARKVLPKPAELD